MQRRGEAGTQAASNAAGANEAPAKPAADALAAEETRLSVGMFSAPLDSLSGFEKSAIAGLVVGTSLVTYALAAKISRDKDTFFVGPLTSGQIAGFWFCLFPVLGWAAVAVASYWDWIVNQTDRVVARRKFIPSDEGYAQLSSAAEFAFYILLFYFCDRTTFIPRMKKKYDRDIFWSLWVLLCAAGLATLRKAKPPAPAPAANGSAAQQGAAVEVKEDADDVKKEPTTYHVKHLQRDQTEEWKGWMQVMFLWYHYFNAKDIYNAIRLYIAAYVWMTGFGNFSYYYIRKDFSFARFCQMQWRLNFMVVVTCAVLGNEYMLYYICMLHTTFTLIIYAILGVQSHVNSSFSGVCLKFAICVAVAVVMWDVPGVFNACWAPFQWLVQYHDPYNTKRDPMHEWQFRSHLDHLIWIIGMLMAFNHPRFDGYLERIDKLPTKAANAIKCSIFSLCILGFYLYNEYIFSLPKKEYNRLHPYTSFIPIVLFIVMRNIFTVFRMYHMHLFEFLGKTTLETYIAQFHIWMATTGTNGAPKQLLRVLPEGYPILNFLVVSVIFFFVSYRLFQTTNTIRTFILPAKTCNAVLQRNVGLLLSAIILVYLGSVGAARSIDTNLIA